MTPNLKFRFSVDLFTRRGDSNVFDVLVLETSAPTVELAWGQVEPQIPAGHRVFGWSAQDEAGNFVEVA